MHVIYENRRAGRAGWVPAVRGGWRRGVPHAERDYLPLTEEVLAAHLSGKMHIGLYPLLDGDRCWWLAADLDGPEAMFDALMHLKAARALQVPRRWRCRVRGPAHIRGCSSQARCRPRGPAAWEPVCCGKRWRCAGSPSLAARPCSPSPPGHTPGKASTAQYSTPCSSPPQSDGKDDSSSTPGASCAPTPARPRPKSTTTTTPLPAGSLQHWPGAPPDTPASASQTPGVSRPHQVPSLL